MKTTHPWHLFSLLALSLALAGQPACAQVEMLTNGGFEAAPFNQEWSGTSTVHDGITPGSARAAKVIQPDILGQEALGGSDFVASLFFAGVDGNASPDNRLFNVQVNAATPEYYSGAALNIRATEATGNLEVYNGSAWVPVFTNAVLASTDGGDGHLDMGIDTIHTYLLRVTGHDWGTPAASYDLELSDPNSTTIAYVTNNLAIYQSGLATQFPLRSLLVTMLYANDGDYCVVDEVSVRSTDPRTGASFPFVDLFTDTDETPWFRDSETIIHNGSTLELVNNPAVLVQPASLVNGDFEATPHQTGWEGSSDMHTGLTGGSAQSARIVNGSSLGQSLQALFAPEWELECYFAGAVDDAGRYFQLQTRNSNNPLETVDPAISLRATPTGDIQVYDDSWQTLFTGVAPPSIDGNGDGDLEDVEDTVYVYRLLVSGHAFGTPGANYDVALSAANSDSLIHQQTGVQFFQNDSMTDGLRSLTFQGHYFYGAGFMVVDDVTFTGDQAAEPILRGTTFELNQLGREQLDFTARAVLGTRGFTAPDTANHGFGLALLAANYYAQAGSHYAVRLEAPSGLFQVREVNGNGGVTNEVTGTIPFDPDEIYTLSTSALYGDKGLQLIANLSGSMGSHSSAALLDATPLDGRHFGLQHEYASSGSYTVDVSRVELSYGSAQLRDMHTTADGMILGWQGVAGRSFGIDATDLLEDTPVTWNPITSNYPEGGSPGTLVTFTNPPPASSSGSFRLNLAPRISVAEQECSLFFDDFETGGKPGWQFIVNAGSESWGIGTPASGPWTAASGVQVAATNLDGDYANSSQVILRTPLIDLSAFTGTTSALVRFTQWFEIEQEFDTGQVFVTEADGTPIGGPLMTVTGSSDGGYQAASVALPLTAQGRQVRVEFRFDSDIFPGTEYPGWYIDDVCVSPVDLGGSLARADFNDLNPGELRPQEGGIGFANDDGWGNTGTITVIPGDLEAPASTSFNVAQGGGSAQSVQGSSSAGNGRQSTRSLDRPLRGTVWFSYLVHMPNGEGRGGIGFNQSDYPAAPPRIFAFSNNVRIDYSDNAYDTTVPDLFTVQQTFLVLGKIEIDASLGGEDRVSLWIDPDLVAGEIGLPAPDVFQDQSDFVGSEITRISVLTYYSPGGTTGATVDHLSIGDGQNGFHNVTGQ